MHLPTINFILDFLNRLYSIFKKKEDSQESNSAQLNFIKFPPVCCRT